MAAGILGAHFYFFNLPDLAVPALLCTLILVLAFRFQSARRLRLPVICTVLALAGVATQIVHRQGHSPRLTAEDTETVLLSGCVVNPPVFSPDRGQFTLLLSPQAAARISVVLKNGQKLALSYGQQIEAAVKVRFPRNFGNPDSFDYMGYLAAQHIYWTGSVSSPSDIRVMGGSCGARPLAWLFAVRTWTLERLDQLYPQDNQTAALLKATLIGETSGVERRWTDAFRATGTYHALVISGLHISVLALTIVLVLRICRIRRIRALAIATVASWLYAFLSGLHAPVMRAAGGFTLYFAASYFFRKTRVLNVLAAIGLAYLAFDPDELFDPSFQLSFLSVGAIGAFAIPLMERFTEPLRASVRRFDQLGYDPQVTWKAAQWRVELRLLSRSLHLWTRLSETHARWLVSKFARLAALIADTIIISACIQFALGLPMVSYFHRLSLTGLSANVVVIPLLSLVVPVGFAAIFTGWHVLALLAKYLLLWAEWMAQWHVRFEPAWRMAALPLWIAILFSVSLILLALAVRHNKRMVPASLFASLVVFAAICWQPWKAAIRPNLLEVTAIDVNQGDSLLLVFPDAETMLVDAGGFPGAERMARKPQMDIGEDVVSPYLWSRQIHHIDYAVLTHGHSDHMGGLPAILDNFRPRDLWIGAEPETAAWQDVRRHAGADDVRIVSLNRSSPPLAIGGTHIRVLAPSPDYVSGDGPSNNDSLVLELTYGQRTVLLTGDAERPIEDDMVSSGCLRPVTLLKVGHHGSNTSSSEEFLDQIAPHFAFISDGYKNQFHHPHPAVLERLALHHTAVFRTDERGLITFLTDGNKVEIKTYR